MNLNHSIIPDWAAPTKIKALVTTRQGGVSPAPFVSFNIAEHVGDKPENVQYNRQLLKQNLPSEPLWLNQIHSTKVVNYNHFEQHPTTGIINADGSYATEANQVCVVMTADCLPVFICNKQGTIVSVVHAGWKGLLAGIIEQAINKVIAASQCQAEDIIIWLGPAIGPERFEVGAEVRSAFSDKQTITDCFYKTRTKDKYLADIYQLAIKRLSAMGIENVTQSNYCTYNDEHLFYSYRRDGQTGRMASIIWIDKQ